MSDRTLIVLLVSLFGCCFSDFITVPLTKKEVLSHPDVIHSKYNSNRKLDTQKKPLENIFDFQYNGQFFLGTHTQGLNLLLDTGSSWTWTPSSTCPSNECTMNNLYKINQSNKFIETTTPHEIQYGIGFVSGFVAQDRLAAYRNGDFTNDFKFMLVEHARDLNNFNADGLVGMSPRKWDEENGDILVQKLYDGGIIDEPIFAFYLTTLKSGEQSILYLGGYSTDHIKLEGNQTYEDAIHWLDIKSTIFWEVELTSASIGGTEISITKESVILDSGASVMYIPEEDYNTIYQKIIFENVLTCETDEVGNTYCDCNNIFDSRYPDVDIKLNDRFTFTLKSQDYLIWSSFYKACLFTFYPDYDSSSYYWLMGDPFLRAFYSIYDMENLQVGLAGVIHDSGEVESTEDEEESDSIIEGNGLYIMIAAAGVVLLMTCLVICCCCCMKKKHPDKSKIHTEDKSQHLESEDVTGVQEGNSFRQNVTQTPLSKADEMYYKQEQIMEQQRQMRQAEQQRQRMMQMSQQQQQVQHQRVYDPSYRAPSSNREY